MNVHPTQMPLIGWVALAVILFSQSTWLFADARKRNAHPWFWGIIGLCQFPMPLLFYWLIERKKYKYFVEKYKAFKHKK